MRNLSRALMTVMLLATLPLSANAAVVVGVSVYLAPPALPVYVQPPPPAVGYIWVPGYWAWAYGGYYWVPGTWALAPAPGLLWTPGYWGWVSGAYLWHAGYWGPHVGFYGGINYGFGYTGVGFEGGYWRGSQFFYNSAVTNIHTTNITNVYNKTVVNNVNVTNVSYNGGTGGVAAKPNAAELAAAQEPHQGFTPLQQQHEQVAKGNNALRASVNGGRPSIAATPRAGSFSGEGVVAAHGAVPYHTPFQALSSHAATGGQPSRSGSPPSHGASAAAQPGRAPSYPGSGAYHPAAPHAEQGHPAEGHPPAHSSPHPNEHQEHGH